MSEQVLVEIYRTGESDDKSTFKNAFTITYFGKIAMIQGVSGNINASCLLELVSYLRNKGMDEIHFFRMNKGKPRKIIKKITPINTRVDESTENNIEN